MEIQWSLALFTVIAGTGAGVLAFAGVSEFFGASKKARFIAAICSLILLVVGGSVSVFHLSQPANFMSAAANLGSFSPISLELIALGLAVIVAIVYLVLVNRESSAAKILCACGILVGIFFGYVSGHGYEIIATRPAWATPAVTFSYLFSALTMGGFLYLAIQAALKDEAEAIKKTALFVAIIAALSVVLYIAYAATAPLGENAMIMWLGAVVVGLIALVAGVLAFLKEKTALGAACAGLVTAVIAAIVFRSVMWLAGSMYLPSFFDLASQSRGLWPF